jgi:hypothetical protein
VSFCGALAAGAVALLARDTLLPARPAAPTGV